MKPGWLGRRRSEEIAPSVKKVRADRLAQFTGDDARFYDFYSMTKPGDDWLWWSILIAGIVGFYGAFIAFGVGIGWLIWSH